VFYHQLTIDVAEEQAAMLAAALEGFAAPTPQSVTARRMGRNLPWRVDANFDQAPDEAALAVFLQDIAPGVSFDVAPLPEEDWLALSQAALPPIRTRRFYVRQPHLPLPADLGARHVLTIEAGLAFGTGHHATTKGCLLALEELETRSPPPLRGRVRVGGRAAISDAVFHRTTPPPNPLPQEPALRPSRSEGSGWEGGTKRRSPRRVLDLGTGTGLLAIAAAKLWPGIRAVASDIDPVATEVARANCRLNGAPGIRCVTAAGFRHEALAPKFDLVLANILAAPLKHLARDVAAHTSPGARVILSGILDEQAADVIGAYRGAGFKLVRRRDLEGWSALVLARV
jgi:ribosomal protein L11 methyltransferase